MFTGIIESLGTIQNIKQGTKSSVLTIAPESTILDDVKLGDSISTNGVCLTVTNFTSSTFDADVMTETLNVTSLAQLSVGSKVNLERALKVSDRLGGHIVSGHVDGVAHIAQIEKQDISYLFTIKAPQTLLRYIIMRGSVCIDGISLTVMGLNHESFTVSIIPHTLSQTVLAYKKVGDIVNIETDIVGKYIENFLIKGSAPQSSSNITEEFLKQNGF